MAEIDELITRWLTQQAGTWRVQQRIWSSATAEPVVLPPMVAERRMVHDVFLEESMQPAAGSGQEPFTRIAYVSFNPVNRRFEHVSLDSRYAPIMFETWLRAPAGNVIVQETGAGRHLPVRRRRRDTAADLPAASCSRTTAAPAEHQCGTVSRRRTGRAT
jgi:hypothetical protein